MARFIENLGRMAMALRKKGAYIGFKATSKQSGLKRADSVVIYFQAKDQEMVYRAMDGFYKIHEDDFKENTPLFAAQMYGIDGRKLKGVSFGQNPDCGKYVEPFESFGSKRYDPLQGLVSSWDPRHPPKDENEVYAAFTQALLKVKVDVDHPAFNLSTRTTSWDEEDEVDIVRDLPAGKDLFAFVRSRSDQADEVDGEKTAIIEPFDEPTASMDGGSTQDDETPTEPTGFLPDPLRKK